MDSARIDIRAELEDVAAQLLANGIEAHINRNDVPLPGVWVTAASIGLDGLSWYVIHARLYVMVADRAEGPAFDDMTEVTNRLLELFNPNGDMTPATVQRAATALPALVVPVDFRCNYAPAP